MGNREQERIKRLRDQQLKARDPLAYDRKLQRQYTERVKRKKQQQKFVKYAVGGISSWCNIVSVNSRK